MFHHPSITDASTISLQHFPLFPSLPAEIRDLIYIAAIWPRLVHIQRDSKRRARPSHLFSTSPIPPLLHTCRESRAALISSGYELAFGIHRSTSPSCLTPSGKRQPRVWFNFKVDALYFALDSWDEDNFFLAKRKHYMELCSTRDCDRVRTLSLSSLGRFKASELKDDVLSVFSELGNLLLVAEHCGEEERRVELHRLRDRQDDLWGWLECDIADVIGHPSEELVGYPISWKDRCRYHRIMNPGTHGREVFRNQARELEEKLRQKREVWADLVYVEVMNNVVVGPTSLLKYTTPKVRYVVVGARSQAEKILRNRQSYWDEVQAKEDWEAEFGHPLLHAEPDPYFQHFEDAHQAILNEEWMWWTDYLAGDL